MMKHLIVLGMLMVLVGCVNQQVNDKEVLDIEQNGKEIIQDVIEEKVVSEVVYQKISPEKAKEMMDNQTIILDVRTHGEFAEGHIEGALLLPVDLIIEGELDLLPNKEQTILVYCRSGNRSKTASNALIEAGYTDVYDFGGIIDWPYEIVK